MKNKTFRLTLSTVLFSVCALCSCQSADEINSANGLAEVNVSLTLADLDEHFVNSSMTSRASGDMIFPITIFYAPEDETTTHLLRQGINTSDFAIKLPSGTHEIYALCGLSSNVVPADINSAVNIRDVASDKYNFALAKQTVTVENDVCTPSALTLTASHQSAWLNVSITDVPSYVHDIQLYAEDLYEWYRFDTGWTDALAPRNSRYTPIPLTISGTTYTASCALPPSLNASTVTISAIVTTNSGYTLLARIPNDRPLTKGSRLNITTDFHGISIVEGDVTIDDWTDDYFASSMQAYNGLTVGVPYFTLPATVVAVGTDVIQLLPHKPMTTTLADIRSWTNLRDINYTLSPSIAVSRWALPTTKTSPNYVLAAIQTCGWSAFCSQFISSGNTPIDQSADNIIAYYDQTNDVFYRYDFQNYKLVSLRGDTTGEYLLYPIGVLSLV